MMKYTEKLLKNERFLRIQRDIREDETDRIYCHHELGHGLDVCRIAWMMYLEHVMSGAAGAEGADGSLIHPYEIKDRIYVTGLLHDIGRSIQYRTGEHHSKAGAGAAAQILREINYPEDQMAEVTDFIRNHHGRQNIYSDKNSIGYYIERADQLSRNCFCCPAADTCKWKDEERNQTIRF